VVKYSSMSTNILSYVSKNILLIFCQHRHNIFKKIQSCPCAHTHLFMFMFTSSWTSILATMCNNFFIVGQNIMKPTQSHFLIEGFPTLPRTCFSNFDLNEFSMKKMLNIQFFSTVGWKLWNQINASSFIKGFPTIPRAQLFLVLIEMNFH
jgi:hypothetical protein